MLAVMQRVLDRQKCAPGLTQQMHLTEIERLANLLDLGDEPRHLPELTGRRLSERQEPS